ncbi:unnamed protein product [Thelazia callipaeda]|uniref:39S ribosomal protein L50, mitochondrial n=1 Tax=Thelazia callipaeda TaxID=103827 RepID=A0A0N5D6L6_THECL|nr:unnamed protein product [Thelazia callipaeda]
MFVDKKTEKKEGEHIADAIHELHVLYMRYFSLDDHWQPTFDRSGERAHLLQRMAVVVDQILAAENRPDWLHPAMFRGPLVSAVCSLPPIAGKDTILMPDSPDPREIYWSKFSICNHSRPLESRPFMIPLQYYPPDSKCITKTRKKKEKLPSSEFTTSIEDNFNTDLETDVMMANQTKTSLPRVGRLPNDKFRDANQYQVEQFVGEILRSRGLQFNRIDDNSAPQAYLYPIPSTDVLNCG